MLALAALGGLLWAAAPQAAAFGGKKNRGGDCCGPAFAGGYTPAGFGGGCGGYTVSYVDQKVTAYKTETETKDVKVMVNKLVDVKEDFKYFECVAVPGKQKVTVQELKSKEEPYKWTVMEPTTVKQTVKVCEYKTEYKDVPTVSYSYTPVVTKVKKTVCEYVTVPVCVTEVVHPAPAPCAAPARGGLFGRLCGKKKKDDCGPPCPAPCETPCPQVVTRTVMQRQAVHREVEVDVTTWQRVEHKGTAKVCVVTPVMVDKEVLVHKCVPVEKSGTRTVHFYVPVEKEVDVVTHKQVEKTGTRVVKKCVQVEDTVKQTFCKLVPYETTVKVPVYTPVPAPCPPAPCPPPCGYAPARHGIGGGCCH
ncbi:MAG: hypothetical protein C0501_20595 [Isosphaera sp.]|nr:hypothetical protein [Isosphaera sp.]